MTWNPAALPDYDLDVIEIGERAVMWADIEAAGTLYADVRDRARAVAAGCYVKCLASLGPGNVPPQWIPRHLT